MPSKPTTTTPPRYVLYINKNGYFPDWKFFPKICKAIDRSPLCYIVNSILQHQAFVSHAENSVAAIDAGIKEMEVQIANAERAIAEHAKAQQQLRQEMQERQQRVDLNETEQQNDPSAWGSNGTTGVDGEPDPPGLTSPGDGPPGENLQSPSATTTAGAPTRTRANRSSRSVQTIAQNIISSYIIPILGSVFSLIRKIKDFCKEGYILISGFDYICLYTILYIC